MTVGSCTSSKASERAKRALPVVGGKADQQEYADNRDECAGRDALATFLGGLDSRCLGTLWGLFDRVKAHARPPSGTGPSARTLRGLRKGTILVTSAGAATKSTMSACSTVVKVNGVGQRCHCQAARMQRPQIASRPARCPVAWTGLAGQR